MMIFHHSIMTIVVDAATSTRAPSRRPTRAPTRFPSKAPTQRPSRSPTATPTSGTSPMPSYSTAPTVFVNVSASAIPTRSPSRTPTSAPSFRQVTVPQFLYYKFDNDVFNSYLKNSVNNAYDAFLWSPAYLDQSVKLSGAASLSLTNAGYVGIPAFTATSSGLAISFWIKTSKLIGSIPDQTIFEFGNGAQGGILRFSLAYGPIINGVVLLASNVYKSRPIYNGYWHFVVWQLSPSNFDTSSYYYVDGNLVASPFSATSYLTVTRSVNYLGVSSDFPRYFTGRLDEFRVFNGFLTSTDVTTLYSANAATAGAPTLSPASMPTATKKKAKSSPIVAIVIPIIGAIIAAGVAYYRRMNQSRNAVGASTSSVVVSPYPNTGANPPPGFGGGHYSAVPQQQQHYGGGGRGGGPAPGHHPPPVFPNANANFPGQNHPPQNNFAGQGFPGPSPMQGGGFPSSQGFPGQGPPAFPNQAFPGQNPQFP